MNHSDIIESEVSLSAYQQGSRCKAANKASICDGKTDGYKQSTTGAKSKTRLSRTYFGGTMKKFSKLLIIFIIILFISASNISNVNSSEPVRVFYNGEIYPLEYAPLLDDDKYYFDASALYDILDLRYYVDSTIQTVYIEYGNIRDIFRIDNLKNSPKYINNQLYIPFDFLTEKFGLSVKTTNNNTAIYILQQDVIDSSMSSVFRNISCNYSINIPTHITIDLAKEDPFQDEVIYITDKNNLYEAVISCEIVDETSLIAMRSYLNDFASTDEEIFDELINYKKSYFRAMQEYFKNNFLFGGTPPFYSESNMKIFAEYDDVFSGQKAAVTLYNIIHSTRDGSSEEVHISIFLPVNSTKSIYTIEFTTDTERLNHTTLKRMSELVDSIEITGLPVSKNELKVFSDQPSINDAKRGIYPTLPDVNIGYTALVNTQSGYRVIYPSSAIPYMHNNIIEPYDYRSFKLSYNDCFSVAVEPQGKGNPVENRLHVLELAYKDKISDIETYKVNLSGKVFDRLLYTIESDNINEYVDSFITVHNEKVYTIQLDSRFREPERDIKEEFAKIAASLEFIKTDAKVEPDSYSFIKYVDPEHGYTVSYPNKWLIQETYNDNFQNTKISNPDYSGPLNISLSEAKINPDYSREDILECLTSNSPEQINEFLSGYSAPFLESISSRLLKLSAREDKNALFIYRLINYLDYGEQNKLCYSVDIIKDDNVYSLFITVSQYLTLDGVVYDNELKSILKGIGSTYGMVDPESMIKNQITGEAARNVIEAVQTYFKRILRLDAEVKNPAYIDSSKESIMVQVDGIPDSGYYIIATKYDPSGNLFLMDRILNRDILDEAVSVLKRRYSEKDVWQIETDDEEMTLKITYRDDPEAEFVKKNYRVSVDRSHSNFNWKLERIDYSNTLADYCEIYLENFLSKAVNVYFQASDEELGNSIYKDFTEKQYVSLYTEFGNSSGYFILGIDPDAESIEAVSYTPVNFLDEQLKSIYTELYPGFEILNYTASDEDKFKINVFMRAQPSRTVSMFRVNKARVVFDKNRLILTLIDETSR